MKPLDPLQWQKDGVSTHCARAAEQPSTESDVHLLAQMEALLPPLGGEITESDHEAIKKMFAKYQHVFALNSADLGRTDLIEHEIDVGEHKPVRLPPRKNAIAQA